MDALRPIQSSSSGNSNPRHSVACPNCGTHFQVELPGDPSIGRRAFPGVVRPKVIAWIVFFSLLSAAWGLFFSDLWTTMPEPHDRYRIFTRIFAVINLPLDMLLLVSSAALMTQYREHGRKAILWWAVVASVVQTISVLATMVWIAPGATTHDVSVDEAQVLQLTSGSPSQAINADAAFSWISIMFLTTWIGWVLTRKHIMPYFQSSPDFPAPRTDAAGTRKTS